MKHNPAHWLVLCLVVLIPSCGGGGSSGGSDSPTAPSPVPPDPTPDPTPTGDPPLSASCAALGPGVPFEQATCTAAPATFLNEVNEAVAFVQSQHPEYFDGRNILNLGAFYVEVIRTLDTMGLCAAYDGEELGVKETDDFNDVYDITSAREEVRSGDNIYIGTCSPAVELGANRPLTPVSEGCNLPPSTFVACGRPESTFYPDVEASINELLVERPELFDPDDPAPGGLGWPALTDGEGYHDAMLDKLRGKGYCAIFDGEEIQIKRGSNEFSEHFDINYRDNYIRQGYGSYRGSCYPAAF